jgi:hypothetical protein
MYTSIVEKHSVSGIDIKAIINRIIIHLPTEVINGLNEITLLNKNEKTFGQYIYNEGRIELYVDDIVGWQPWLLKKTYLFPYMCIGIELGGLIEEHVNRDIVEPNGEYIPKNPLKYIYPSLGVFKYVLKLLFYIRKAYLKIIKRGTTNG